MGIRYSLLLSILAILLGGTFEWIFLNQQEYQISLIDAQIEYLSNYVSAFVTVAIEIAAAYYFFERYDLGSRKRDLMFAIFIGIAGFLSYVIGELMAAASSLGNSNVSASEFLYYELSPAVLDYGNALVIMLSLFGLVLLIRVLLKINPIPRKSVKPRNASGILGGFWTAGVTTASAMVCCGPLPGAIALATGISSLYFTELIDIQPILVLISVPLILYAIFLANQRAKFGCRLRLDNH